VKNQEPKEVKTAKAPWSLRKPVKIKKFEKKYVKYIEHPQDKKFFLSCFDKKEEDYVIHGNLAKEDVKKLKLILKSVKGNKKGPVRVIPLFFAAALAAAIVIFFLIFANPLLGRAMELGLEAAFEAKSDVRNFRLSVLKFQISIGSITVANRDSPMQNLFEMGKTEIRMKPEAVLRGKIYIEEIRADTIRFGTPRKVSGALPARPPKPAKEKPPKSDAPPMIDLKNFDAMELLNREYDKLSTPKLYDEAIAAYNETLTKWQGQVDSAKAKTEELRTKSQPILNMNISNIRDVETIKTTVQDINTMVAAAKSAADDATNMVGGIEADINKAKQLESNARNALTSDINHLKSYIDLGSGAAFGAIEPFIRDILSDSAEEYLDYGMRALEVLEKLKAQAAAKPKSEPKPKKEKKVAFKGRDVNFPLRSYPKFYLGVLASDFTLDTWNWAFALRDVSSDPDLTGKPVSLKLGLAEQDASLQRKVDFDGSADFRTNPPQRFKADLSGAGFPISLGDQLSKAGINGFKGDTAFKLNLSGKPDGGVSGGGNVNITSARLVDPNTIIAEAVDTAIKEAGRVDLGIQYTHHVDAADEFKITTNLADLITRALRRAAEAYAQKAMDEIERALRKKIDQYIDGKFASKDEVDALFKIARGDKAAKDQLMGSLTSKRTELEKKATSMVTDELEKLQNEAKKQAEQSVQDILQGNKPELPSSLPNLPSTGGLKLPGR